MLGSKLLLLYLEIAFCEAISLKYLSTLITNIYDKSTVVQHIECFIYNSKQEVNIW